MDTMSIINLVVACFCAFMSGWAIGREDYGWAAINGALTVLNFIVAWL